MNMPLLDILLPEELQKTGLSLLEERDGQVYLMRGFKKMRSYPGSISVPELIEDASYYACPIGLNKGWCTNCRFSTCTGCQEIIKGTRSK